MNGNRSSVRRVTASWDILFVKSLTANQNAMVTKFEASMAKLAVVGHNPRDLVDCSDVIPVPSRAKTQSAKLPAGKTLRDIEAAVSLFYLN